jgi:hypothetical protein
MFFSESFYRNIKKLFIWISISIISFATIISVLVYSIPYFMDLEAYKKLIFEEIQQDPN